MKKIILTAILAFWSSYSYCRLNNDNKSFNHKSFNCNSLLHHDATLNSIDDPKICKKPRGGLFSYGIPTENIDFSSGNILKKKNVKRGVACDQPSYLYVTDIASTAARLQWYGGSAEYTLEYGLKGFTPGTGIVVSSINTTFYDVGSLTPFTEYDFYVTGVCSDSSSEISLPGTFKTSTIGSLCNEAIQVTGLPFFTADNTLNYGNNIYDSYPGCGTSYGFLSGNDVVYSFTNTTTGDKSLSVTLDPLKTKGLGVFVFDQCIDIANNCRFSQADKTSSVRNIPEVIVSAGKTIYIVISSSGAPEDTNFNFSIQEIYCKAPSELGASAITANSAKLTWSENSGASSWQVFVQNADGGLPATDGVTATDPTNFVVSQLTETGDPLLADTGYQYWVRSDCGDGLFSPWAGPFRFNLPSCSAVCTYTLKLTDAAGNGWNGTTMDVVQNGFIVATLGGNFKDGIEQVESLSLCEGPFELYWNGGFSDDEQVGLSVINPFGQTIYSLDQALVYPGIQIFAGNANCSNPECFPPKNLQTSAVSTDKATFSWEPDGPLPVSWDIYISKSGAAEPDSSTLATENTTTFPYVNTISLEPDTDYNFYVRAVCSFAGENNWSKPVAFKTLEVCASPTDLQLSASTLNSVDLTWNGTASSYQYIVLAAGSPEPGATDASWGDKQTTTNGVSITGLTAARLYDVYIRSFCTAGVYSKIKKITVNTATCPDENRCSYTFTMTTNSEGGWVSLNQQMEIRQAGIVVATIGADFDGGGVFEKSVQVPLCAGVPFEVFWKEGGYYFMEVGLAVKDAAGKAIFYMPATNLNRLKPGTVIFTDTPVCKEQTCFTPTKLTVTNVLSDSAQVSWTENNTTPFAPWDILILPAADLPPTQDATGWTTVTTNPYNLSGLNPNTSYIVYVRTKCSSTDQSYWSSGAEFQTLLGSPADYCDYTFVLKTSVAGSTWHPDMSLSVLQGGVEVKRFTGPPTAYSEFPVKVPLFNTAPFELYWNIGGIFDNLVGIDILDPDGVIVYSKDFGIGEQGTVLYSGTATCTPNPCGAPIQLTASNPSTDKITLGWSTVGTPDKYEVLILPANSLFPAADAVGAVESATATFIPTVSSGLVKPGVLYEYYVRAVCDGGDRLSSWSGPKKFSLLLANDECTQAVAIPVNPGVNLVNTINSTIAGATQSSKALMCSGDGMGSVVPDDDVWFEFTATSTNHAIVIKNIKGILDAEPYSVLSYHLFAPNTCGVDAAPLICQRFNDFIIARDLIPGQTYKLRVYTFEVTPDRETPDLTITFDIGVITLPNYLKIDPLANATASEAQTSAENLVNNVLLNGTCGTATNVTFSTGFLHNYADYGGTGNGIGSFDKNGSSFSLSKGIVLATGTAKRGEGPLSGFQGDGGVYWPGWSTASGDDDLNKELEDNGLSGGSLNSTKLEFDFIPSGDKIDFNFVFASQDYGISDCRKISDTFMVLLTDVETGITKNIAVVPGTQKPVSVVTVNNNDFYNDAYVDGDPNRGTDDCPSVNAAYFDRYFTPLGEFLADDGSTLPGENPYLNPINYEGYTKPLKAASSVVPGKKYHIKFAIADLADDWGHDAAVFIGSFDLEMINLGADLLKSNGQAVCYGSTITLDSKLDPAKFNIVWEKDGVVLTGENKATLVVSAPGEYKVLSRYGDVVCSGPTTGADSIIVEYYNEIITGVPADITLCSIESSATFNLTQNSASILGTLGSDYSVSYFTTAVDAAANLNAISSPGSYTNTSNPQTIFARVSNSLNNCYKVVSFTIQLKDLYPQFTLTPDFSLCEFETANLSVTPLNYNNADVVYAWTLNGAALPDTTPTIAIVDGGRYEVTVSNISCSSKKQTSVTTIFATTPNFSEIAPICKTATAPILETTSPNGVSGTWSPAVIDLSKEATYMFIPNSDQCANSQTLVIKPVICEPQKGISPNGDGLNDYFDLSDFKVKKLTVFNRYGLVVFSLDNYTKQWYGTTNSGKELPDGTYYYVIEQQNDKPLTGWIYVTH
ncbi:fibronectin type III domain-containing protein [Flavobacterium sp. 3-210]